MMVMFVTGVPGAISSGFLLDKFKRFKVIGLVTSIFGKTMDEQSGVRRTPT